MIVGREGRFSAGFDLATMTASVESMRTLVVDGARFLMRLYGLPLPTVSHARAMRWPPVPFCCCRPIIGSARKAHSRSD